MARISLEFVASEFIDVCLHAQECVSLYGRTMVHHQLDQRVDLTLRQFVGSIIEYLVRGGDHANALMNMAERGVPKDVQRRVIEGNATRH